MNLFVIYDDSFQSTPSVWRETELHRRVLVTFPISIHSLRVEGDKRNGVKVLSATISIHSLRVEGDLRYLPQV